MRGHSLPSSERHSSIKPYTDRRQTAARQPSVVGYSRWRVSHLSEEGNSHRASRSLTTVRHCTSSVRTSTVRRLTTDVRHQSPGQRQAPDKHLPPARRGRRDKPHQMSSCAGQLNKSVRMEKQQQGGNDSRLSLGQGFSDKGRQSSARLRHQSLDRGMDRPSLDQRLTGTSRQLPTTASATVGSMDNIWQLPTTASRCRWTQASSVDRQQMGQQFDDNDYRLSATGFHHLEAAVEQQEKGVGPQLPTTAITSHGQRTSGSSVAMDHGYNGHQATSSHGARTSINVDVWTSDGIQHSSISGSAGAQLRNTDKASKTDMESRTARHDNQASIHGKIGSKESRLATLRRTLDCNEEVDDFASLNVDSIGQRSAPPSAMAGDESSAGHRIYASPEGPKVVDVNLQVGLDSWNVEEELATCRTDGPHRFSTIV